MTATELIVLGALVAWIVCAFGIVLLVDGVVARARAPRMRVVPVPARSERPRLGRADVLASR